MSAGRLLTLDDLYSYYSTHSRSTHFSSRDSGCPLVVQVPANFALDNESDSTEGLLPVVLQSCHIGRNVNHSIIEEDVMKRALSSFSNRPILGYIHQVDGEWQFYRHNLHKDENGDIIYDETPIGIIPESCNARLEYDKDKDKTYVVVNGYVFDEYSKAGEILRREKECPVSVELAVREFSYKAKEHCLVIEDMYFSGVTILGKDLNGNEVKPGMEGSNIKLADFSIKNNSLFADKYELQIIEMQRSLDKLITCFNINNSKKGGSLMNHFEELLSKYGKTAEDVTFEYEGMSDEEMDDKFREVFGEIDVEQNETNDSDNNEDETPQDAEGVVSGENTEDVSEISEEESQSELGANEVDNVDTYTLTYELSHDDIRHSLYQLLTPVGEADSTAYYIVEVFDSYFVYGDLYSGGKFYGQAYTKTEESVAFDGERYDLFMELLTAEEKAELDAMRSNYASMSERLKAYEDADNENKKVNLLKAEDYVCIRDNEKFDKLVKNHKDITYEELQSKCDQILLSVVKAGKYSLSDANEKSSVVSKKQFANPKVVKRKSSRYGNLFSKDKDED